MMPIGRRISMMIIAAIGIVGTGLTLIEQFIIFNIGRILLGFAAGSVGSVVIRMIVEFMPERR